MGEGGGGCWRVAGPCPPCRWGLQRCLGHSPRRVWLGLRLVGLGWPFPSHALLQEVAVEALVQATGLPADLVHHALTPLTHGEGILVWRCPPGGERGAGAPWGGAGLSPQRVLGLGCMSLLGKGEGWGESVSVGTRGAGLGVRLGPEAVCGAGGGVWGWGLGPGAGG